MKEGRSRVDFLSGSEGDGRSSRRSILNGVTHHSYLPGTQISSSKTGTVLGNWDGLPLYLTTTIPIARVTANNTLLIRHCSSTFYVNSQPSQTS